MTTNSQITPTSSTYSVLLETPDGAPLYTVRQELLLGSKRKVITGYRGPRRLGSVNPCVHTTTSWVAEKIDVYTKYPYGSYVVHGLGSYACHPMASAMPDISSDAIEKALSYLRGEIPADVLLPAFVIELPQAIGLVGQLRQAIKVVRGNSLRDFAREIASGHLAYAFGIAPLISDLQKLRTLTNRIKKKVAYLADFSNVDYRPVKVGISMSRDEDTFTCENTAIPCEAYDVPSWKKSVFNHASVFGRCRRTRQLVAADTRAAYLDALGIGKIGSTIWEEIPFSFVADWIYRCGDILEGLDHSFFKGCLEVTHVGFQSKVIGVGECRVRPLTYVAPLPPTHVGTLYSTIYNRSPNIPSTSNWGDPGVRQITLSGSLILQKVLG